MCAACSRNFYDRRIAAEIEGDNLGDEFKGYVFRISGGNDKQGFPMVQGILSSGRVRLLLTKGAKAYKPRRTGERKRRSVRGCIVGADLSVPLLLPPVVPHARMLSRAVPFLPSDRAAHVPTQGATEWHRSKCWQTWLATGSVVGRAACFCWNACSASGLQPGSVACVSGQPSAVSSVSRHVQLQ